MDLEADLAETVGEMDKSRHLLITQVKINDDYKKEVYLIQSKMEDNKAEFDAKMLEYAQLLDIRAARIKVYIFFLTIKFQKILICLKKLQVYCKGLRIIG